MKQNRKRLENCVFMTPREQNCHNFMNFHMFFCKVGILNFVSFNLRCHAWENNVSHQTDYMTTMLERMSIVSAN